MPSWKEIVKALKKLDSKRVKLRMLPFQNPQKASHDHSGHRRTEETKALKRQEKATESSKGSRSKKRFIIWMRFGQEKAKLAVAAKMPRRRSFFS
jgi:hypothetical protein